MRLGLLVCDHVPERHRAAFGDYEAFFRNLLRPHLPDLDLVAYDVRAGCFPAFPAARDAYLTTGSAASVYDPEPWIGELQAFVRTLYVQEIPLVGVCFGHQLIAEALGGRVGRSPRGWGVGVQRFGVKGQRSWMTPPLEDFALAMSCQDQVERLPPGAAVVAGNAFCPVGMFTVGEHFLGVQGHPEFPLAYARTLLLERRERIGEATAREALPTLEGTADGHEVAAWLVAFLRAAVGRRSGETLR